jgi:hypothetical protein
MSKTDPLPKPDQQVSSLPKNLPEKLSSPDFSALAGVVAGGPGAAVVIRIRVRKEDSAFVYAVLEASEGMAAYSTLDFRPGDAHRDLELQVPVGFLTDVEALLERLATDCAGGVYRLQ